MDLRNKVPGAGKTLAGYLLGMLVAVISPLVLVTEVISLMYVVVLPAAAALLINRWFGRAPALFTALLQMVVSALYMGSAFMWMSLFMTLLPVLVVLRNENKPFFDQLKYAISAFGTGLMFTVVVLYLSYGGNMIERVLLEFPKALRTLPQEYMQIILDNFAASFGMPVTLDEFYKIFDDAIFAQIPVYQTLLPGRIFGGSLISAVLCVGLNGYLRSRKDASLRDAWVPIRHWALPASATGGLIMILAISYAMSAFGMQNGETVFYTVMSIASVAFCIQTLGSVSRNLYISKMNKGLKAAMLGIIVVLCFAGFSGYITIYGAASALFGRKGAMRQRIESMNKNNKDNSDK